MPFLRGSTQEKWSFEVFRFDYGKVSNDKRYRTVGSEIMSHSLGPLGLRTDI